MEELGEGSSSWVGSQTEGSLPPRLPLTGGLMAFVAFPTALWEPWHTSRGSFLGNLYDVIAQLADGRVNDDGLAGPAPQQRSP
jgi:hypothetical protein